MVRLRVEVQIVSWRSSPTEEATWKVVSGDVERFDRKDWRELPDLGVLWRTFRLEVRCLRHLQSFPLSYNWIHRATSFVSRS